MGFGISYDVFIYSTAHKLSTKAGQLNPTEVYETMEICATLHNQITSLIPMDRKWKPDKGSPVYCSTQKSALMESHITIS